MHNCDDNYISIVSNWYHFFSLTLASCGILGNLHTLISSDQRKHRKLSRYVHALCIWDIAILAFIVFHKALNYTDNNIDELSDENISFKPSIIVHIQNNNVSKVNYNKNILALSFGPFSDVYVTASSWMLTAITAKRYLAVSKPFKERIRSKNNVKWICLIIGLVSLLINVPRAFYEKFHSSCINLVTGRNNIRLDKISYLFYLIFARILLDLFFTCPFPPLFNIILTFKILHYRHNRLRRSTNNSNVDGRKTSTGENLMDYMSFRKSSHGRSLSKVSSTTLQLFGGERRIKSDSFKSPLFLTLLNGKFFICNVVHMVIMLLRWTSKNSVSDEIMEILKEINIAAIILHSSTNWIMFAKFNTRSLSRNCVPDYQIFDNHEKKVLTSMWSHIDASGMGKDLLISLIIDNPLLIKSLVHDVKEDIKYSREELESISRIAFVGSRIGCFIESMMTTLKNTNMVKEDFVKIRAELRHVGMIHYIERVKINSQDWFSIKRYLVRKMMKECECVISSSKNTCSQSHSKTHNEQLLVANKFSSFLIHELKNGFVCETVRTSHANGIERGEGCGTSSGIIYSSTGNLITHNGNGCTLGANKSFAKMSTASCSLPLTSYIINNSKSNQIYRQNSQTSQSTQKTCPNKLGKKFIIGSRDSLQSSRQSSLELPSTSPSSIEISDILKKKFDEEKVTFKDIEDSVEDIDVNVMYV
uniref:G_PROTEIN_RECEP_F1_2 domain-containing protein n=1 Tax=Parastrongyloides trichosuri TaxID=131310 RepID=A0A0N4ZHI5_PARTI